MITAWVVGGSGLLGAALHRAIRHREGWRALPNAPLPWDADEAAFAGAVRAQATRLAAAAGEQHERDADGRHGAGWAILWAAGRAVPASSETDAATELDRARLALGVVAEVLGGADVAPASGTLFLASSAGGVYAGSIMPPFTEATEPAPTSPYGRLKLALEAEFGATARALRVPAVVGRIANLYGPDQDLAKPQGVISHLGIARFTPRMASLYVPLDTIRDYLHADDAAETVLDAIERAGRERGTAEVTTKIIASGGPATLSTLLATLRGVTHARPRAVLGSSPLAAHQATDLRLRSIVWPELDRRPRRGLPEGIAGAAQGVLAAVQRGDVAPLR